MKILHTNFLHGWGGQSNRILNVCRGLAERGHAVVIAAPGDSELVRRARSAGLATDGSVNFARGFRPLSFARDVRHMSAILAREQFDIIHTHGSADSWLVALTIIRAVRLRRISKRLPIVRTKHNIFPIADHFANRWLYGRVFDRIICISRAILEQCAAKPYIRRERLALIHSAIDLQRFAQPEQAAVEALRAQWAGRHPVLVIVGRLRAEKGHRFLFEAVARLRQKFAGILLIVAGDGSMRQELGQLASDLGIGENVRFLGFRTDIAEILAAADLFVLPSIAEGLGTAAIEASAAARPIIASRVGGIGDVVRDGDTGLLIEPGDADALSHAIEQLISQPDLSKRLAQAARRHAFEHFALDALIEKNLAVYQGLLGTPQRE